MKLTLAYDGTDFRGWARQPAGRSRVIEEDAAFGRLLSAETTISTASLEFAGTVRLSGSSFTENSGTMARGRNL